MRGGRDPTHEHPILTYMQHKNKTIIQKTYTMSKLYPVFRNTSIHPIVQRYLILLNNFKQSNEIFFTKLKSHWTIHRSCAAKDSTNKLMAYLSPQSYKLQASPFMIRIYWCNEGRRKGEYCVCASWFTFIYFSFFFLCRASYGFPNSMPATQNSLSLLIPQLLMDWRLFPLRDAILTNPPRKLKNLFSSLLSRQIWEI